MRFLLRLDCFADAAELALNALDLMACRFHLPVVQLRASSARQPPLRPVHDRHHHLQIA